MFTLILNMNSHQKKIESHLTIFIVYDLETHNTDNMTLLYFKTYFLLSIK